MAILTMAWSSPYDQVGCSQVAQSLVAQCLSRGPEWCCALALSLIPPCASATLPCAAKHRRLSGVRRTLMQLHNEKHHWHQCDLNHTGSKDPQEAAV